MCFSLLKPPPAHPLRAIFDDRLPQNFPLVHIKKKHMSARAHKNKYTLFFYANRIIS